MKITVVKMITYCSAGCSFPLSLDLNSLFLVHMRTLFDLRTLLCEPGTICSRAKYEIGVQMERGL